MPSPTARPASAIGGGPAWARLAAVALAAVLPTLPAVSCGDGAVDPEDSQSVTGPFRVEIVAGNGQSDTVAHSLAEELVVRVTDSRGRGVEGMDVTWSPRGGGFVTPKRKGKTDSFGRAAGSWQLGTIAGAQQVDVVVGDVDTLTFDATALADVPVLLTVVGGDGQTAQAGHPLPDSIVVRSVDQYDNPTPDVPIAWTASDAGQLAADATTDEGGTARAAWSLGGDQGERTLTAALGAGPSAEATAVGTGPPALLEILAGDGQTGIPGQPLPDTLEVVVRDAAGVQVGGVPVQWDLVSGTGSLSPERPTTDGSGVASAAWRLGPELGTQTVSATVAGLPSAVFSATAATGPVDALVVVGGDGQTGTVGAPLADSLLVRVEDAFGNPVGGVAVDWQTADGSVGPSSVTNAAGEARTAWTLGTVIGDQTAAASVGGLTATFGATGTADVPVVLTKILGDLQSGIVGTLLSDGLVVRVEDEYGNPVEGVDVDWLTTDGSLGTTVSVTDAAGEARIDWTLGILAGAQSASVSAGGLGVTFDATGLADVPAAILEIAGDGQSGLIGTLLSDPLVVQVEDQYGNPVPGATVDWVVTLGLLGTTSPTVSVTDAAGRASTSWTLGLLTGLQLVEGRVGTGLIAEFTATALGL